MNIKELKENEYIDSIDILTHRQNDFSSDEDSFNISKKLDNRIITDGEVEEKKEEEILLNDKYVLDDGYIIEDVKYMKKQHISFKNYSYVISYDIVYKQRVIADIEETYMDIYNMTIYIKNINDIRTINHTRKLARSIKKTIKSFNNSLLPKNDIYLKQLDQYEINNSNKIYGLKRF